MSETNSKQKDTSSGTPEIESPKQSDELGAEDLDKVAGGMMVTGGGVIQKHSGSVLIPCEGGE